MNYLIVDLNITLDGHKMGFIKETWLYLSKRTHDTHTYHFLVNETAGIYSANTLHLHTPDSSVQSAFSSLNGSAKYAAQWEYIQKKASELRADRIVLMEFDLYQLAIIRDRRKNIPIDGILFRPFCRQKPMTSAWLNSITFKLKKLQKKVLLHWAVKNTAVRKVFVLNDRLTVQAMNKNLRPVFAYLPDPVFDIACNQLPDIREKFNIPSHHKILLIFGYLDDRKNIPNILRALADLPHPMHSNLSLLIIGKAASNYKPLIEEALQTCPASLHIIHKDEFVDDCEMDALFAQSDLVLRMNVNYFASSGIIGLAARYNKPSLVSDYGIVADLTEKYRLGKLADPLNTGEITRAIQNFLESPEDWKTDGSVYYQDHKTSAFVETLLELT